MIIRPHAAAIGIILNQNKSQVLLVKRKDVPVWVLPGGGIDPSETPSEAAIREVKEETGLTVIIERQSGDYYPINRLSSQTSVYVCTPITHHIQSSNETADCRYFPIEELPSTFFFLHHDWLREALTSTQLVVRPIDQITYFKVIKYALRHPYQILCFLFTRLKTRNDQF